MNKYNLISLSGLLLLVVALPIYAWLEPVRMEQAQAELRQQFVADAAVIYVENCAICHGAAGEGVGSIPSLDNDGLRNADYDFLYKTIARGRYDTIMSGWHRDEGGILNDYQVDEMVALIRYADWSHVREWAATQGLIPPTLPAPQVEDEFLEQIAALNPEGSVWAEGMRLFASNCTICHGINAEGSDLAVSLNNEEIRAMGAAELVRIISEGVPGTMMAGWSNVLASTEIEALAVLLQNWDVIEDAGLELTRPEPIHIDLDNPEEVLALGERIFSTICAACHGEDGSGGTGPALNSQQVLTRISDEQIRSTIINGGRRRNSSMPSFGDRLTSVEIEALVSYIRGWAPTAPWVENPRGTEQGGGPPWLRTTPDSNNPATPQEGANGIQGGARGGGQGGPPWRTPQSETATPVATLQDQGPSMFFSGQVVSVNANLLIFRDNLAGKLVEAMLGPPWFWLENGILLSSGDQIDLEGFDSSDHIEVDWLTNHTTGDSIQLRTPEGMPVWNQ